MLFETPDRSLPAEYEGVRLRVAEALTGAGISLAVLHGSRARGDAHVGSDLDIGLLAADGKPLSYSTMGILAAELAALLGGEADVSDLATTDAIFRFEVAKSARVLFEDSPGRFSDFLGQTFIDYDDIQRFVPELIAGVARRARASVARDTSK
jgi:predicted nucleotidyltransferase